MKVDCIIVGQGIAGTLLSFRLLEAGRSVLVIDDGHSGRASRVAGAVINPNSGKRGKPAPGSGYLLPAALQCYESLGALLQKPFLQQLPLYIFSGSQTGRPAADVPATRARSFFTAPDSVQNVWTVDAAALLNRWRSHLQSKNAWQQETFLQEHLCLDQDLVRYREHEAGSIVFCDGASARMHTLFGSLPFTANRGEALLLSIPGLPADALYHHDLRLVPRSDGLFWCGSNYRWAFEGLEPDAAWRRQAIQQLQAWLRIPFRVEDHIVAERPTTAGQIPFVGLHPSDSRIGILNGLGTRGFSAGPFWAGELARKLDDKSYAIRHYDEAWLHRKMQA